MNLVWHTSVKTLMCGSQIQLTSTTHYNQINETPPRKYPYREGPPGNRRSWIRRRHCRTSDQEIPGSSKQQRYDGGSNLLFHEGDHRKKHRGRRRCRTADDWIINNASSPQTNADQLSGLGVVFICYKNTK